MEDELFERITRLLGQPVDSPLFRLLIQDLGEAPTEHGVYAFQKSGFALIFDKGMLTLAILNAAEADAKKQWLNPFSGNYRSR